MPGLTPAWGAVLAEAASVCLESQGHGLVVGLAVEGEFAERLLLERLRISEQMRNAYRYEAEGEDQFQESVLLEISGIRRGTERTIRGRVREKIIQMQTHSPLSTERGLVAIVEFSRPLLRVVKP
jgi:hypothetical protein